MNRTGETIGELLYRFLDYSPIPNLVRLVAIRSVMASDKPSLPISTRPLGISYDNPWSNCYCAYVGS